MTSPLFAFILTVALWVLLLVIPLDRASTYTGVYRVIASVFLGLGVLNFVFADHSVMRLVTIIADLIVVVGYKRYWELVKRRRSSRQDTA